MNTSLLISQRDFIQIVVLLLELILKRIATRILKLKFWKFGQIIDLYIRKL